MSWTFRKREKDRLLKAIEAIQEIRKRGYECQEEARAALHVLDDLLRAEGRERPIRGIIDQWCF